MSQKIVIVTPWFGEFAGGAEVLAKSLAIEFNRRGIEALVFTTCCRSPYDNWWSDYYEEGESLVYGVKTFRFSVNRTQKEYQEALSCFIHTKEKMTLDLYQNFFISGINSDRLVEHIGAYLDRGYEVIAMPYYQGLTHSVVNHYPGRVSITPCFHDEEPFYWKPVETMLDNAKHIFYNAHEEKTLTIKSYGSKVGRKVVESTVTGVGVESRVPVHLEEKKSPLKEAYFIYMGRKERGKNVDLLIDWFKEYSRKSEVKLLFIGGGDASLIPNDDTFVDYGYVSEEEKMILLKGAVALINLSENESFSIVLMEAWLQKTPTIVYEKCAVTRGHAIRANAGLYPETKEEFLLCLDYLLDHKDERTILGDNGFDYVKTNYTHDVVLEKYLEVLGSE
jgi:glycosyltransferase involved in cell wall biosynthesis